MVFISFAKFMITVLNQIVWFAVYIDFNQLWLIYNNIFFSLNLLRKLNAISDGCVRRHMWSLLFHLSKSKYILMEVRCDVLHRLKTFAHPVAIITLCCIHLAPHCTGNACTSCNNNSSRFGKYIVLQYDRNQSLVGAHIQAYLLEKTRVVRQDFGNHNFHIFYQVCKTWLLDS